MKNPIVLVFVLFCLSVQQSFSQSVHAPGPAERRLSDSLCASLNRLDLSKIGNGQEAKSAFMDCFMKLSDMFEDVANERKVEMTDNAAMTALGQDIAKNLMKEKCQGFLKLAVKFAEKSTDNGEESGFSEGSLKRIDLKGFNYMVINDQSNSEKSFLWLRQFPGSEKFMNGATGLTGKHVKIKWNEIEVYLPQAKGYYKVKEITGIDLL